MNTSIKVVGNKIKDTDIFLYYPDDEIIGKNINEIGQWEPELTDYFIKYIREIKNDFIFIDIGAHVGYFSLICANIRKDCTVYAFEPNKKISNIFKLNAIVYNNIIINECAIGSKNEEKELYCSYNNTGDNSLSLEECKKYNSEYYILSCKIRNIDSFNIDWDKVKIIKIDTQGTELDILLKIYSKAKNNTLFICEEDKNLEGILRNNEVEYNKIMYDLIWVKTKELYES